jgi:hypothetical protein
MQITFLYWYDNPNAARLPYLRAALDAVLGGNSPAILATQPAGCTIKTMVSRLARRNMTVVARALGVE